MKMTTMVALVIAAGMPALAPACAAQVVATADDRPDITLSREDRDLAIGNLIKSVREQHFSVAEAERITRQIERRWHGGQYKTITSGRLLAATLTKDLRAVSGDPHFLVDYFFRARPYPAPRDDISQAQQQQDLALTNYGIRSAERLDGNIGYLRLDKFAPAQAAGPILLGAMAMLGATDALIIDLRNNGGGYGETVAFLAAQLLPEPVRLSDVVARDGITQIWAPVAMQARYLDKPVYVLTSARTFSAAEGFAYDLQALGRVKVVGEPTRGGANPVARTLLSSRFWMLIPVAKATNPRTGRNWEGTGVTPDIRASADQALAVAQRDAARQLITRHKDDGITRELETILTAN